jgi:cell division protein ZapA
MDPCDAASSPAVAGPAIAGDARALAGVDAGRAVSAQVKILDKEYQVNCPLSEQEALMKSARYLDENMRKIKGRGNIHGVEKIAVMAALNITHDMLKKNRLIKEKSLVTEQQIKNM